MYNVMICDDESLIIEEIKSIINWDEINLNVLQTAKNGKDALEKFKKYPTDIIITDINMPIMNGIEFIKEIRNIKKDTKVIIISGYEEFSYAKEAISMGVMAYLLKPIDEEELTKILKEAIKDIDIKYKEIYDISNYNLIKSLLNGKATYEDVINAKSPLNICIEDSIYIVSVVVTKNKTMINNIKNTDIFYYKYNNIILITSFSREKSKNDIAKFYKQIIADIEKNEDNEAFIAIGSAVDDILNINKSFKTSSIVKKGIITTGFGIAITKDDLEYSSDEMIDFKEEIANINSLVVAGEKEDMVLYIDNIIDKNKRNSQYIYGLASKLVILYDNLKIEFRIDSNGIYLLGDDIVDVLNINSIEEMKKYLKNKFIYIIDNISYENDNISPIVMRIIKYTIKNYDKHISLKELAPKYNINTSYLGQMFIRDMGIGFSEYLNKVRIAIAKDLILNTNKKISNISKEVGYTDISYFYRKFKKYYGVTPVSLREIQN